MSVAAPGLVSTSVADVGCRRACGGALALLACAATLPGTRVQAQPQLSERATVGQRVAGTTIRLEYSRPVARGRDSLFGRVVHRGETWMPGANWATTLEADRDVLVEGRRLPQGQYSMWAVPRPDRWTLLLHRRARLYHTNRPDTADAVLRVEVRPDSGPHTEVLTWDFPDVARGGTTLRLRWGQVDRPSPPRRGFDLVPAGAHRFYFAAPGPDGQLASEPEVVWVFTVARGRATGFETQLDDGTVQARARRVP